MVASIIMSFPAKIMKTIGLNLTPWYWNQHIIFKTQQQIPKTKSTGRARPRHGLNIIDEAEMKKITNEIKNEKVGKDIQNKDYGQNTKRINKMNQKLEKKDI